MEIQQLKAFVAVADSGSFSVSAERLHLSQPAVSKRIRALEDTLDVRLLDRIGRRVQLTAAGATLLPRARRVLADLDDIETEIRDLSGRIAGVLEIATSHHIGLHRLPPLLRRFDSAYPAVRLEMHFVDSEEASELLEQGAAELAVVTLDPEGPAKLTAEPLWHDPLVFLAAPDHPLAARAEVTLSELAAHTAILPDMATFTGRIVAGLFAEAGLTLTARLATNYLETVRMMAAVGLGWTVLPATMADARLAVLEIADAPPIARTLGYLVNPARAQSNAARAFIALLRSAADQRRGGSGAPGSRGRPI